MAPLPSMTRRGRVLLLVAPALLYALGTHAAPSDPDTTESLPAMEDAGSARTSGSTFEVRAIPRASHPLAQATVGRSIGIRAPRPSGPVLSPLPGERRRAYWNTLALQFAGNRSLPALGGRTYEAVYSLRGMRLLARGRLEADLQWNDRDGQSYLSRAGLRAESFTGWRLQIGDAAPTEGGPAFQGLSGRGISLERAVPGERSGLGLRAGLFLGRAPVHTTNMIDGRFPRRLAAAYAGIGPPRTIAVLGQVLAVSDTGPPAGATARAIEVGGGYGLSTTIQRKRSSLSADLFRSDLRFDGEDPRAGIDGRLRGRTAVGAVSLGASVEASRGTPYRAGPLGALVPVPRSVAEVDLSGRIGRGATAGLWAGRWNQIPEPVSTGDDGFGPLPARSGSLAVEGRQWGGRIGWTLPYLRTGMTLSQEIRWRSLPASTQQVVTRFVSLDQKVARRVMVRLQGNRLEEKGRGGKQYLTGRLSIDVSRGAVVSLEHQTAWQEPLGMRLLSIAELSTARLLRNRLRVSARVTRTLEEAAAGFQVVQTEGSAHGQVALGKGAFFSLQYRIGRSGANRVESIAVGFTHNLATRTATPSPSLEDPALELRQILGGVVFEDLNGDGARQEGEPGVSGVAVVLDNNIREPLMTDLAGRFRTLVPQGRHHLRLLPESIPIHYALDGTGGVELEVPQGRFVERDFPLIRPLGSIEGRVVLCDDPDAAPPPLAVGRREFPRIRVVLDGAQFTTTDASGGFAFRRLAAGQHEVAIDPRSVPFGYRVTGGEARRLTVATGGVTRTECEFRIFRLVQRQVLP